jgi:glycosyltransferase involved in cell wall biosynthesis
MNSPFFSICIPQYNRTSFLLRVLESLNTQTFRNFEICISDDCSTDGREQEIINYLQETALKFEYSKTEKNIRYDKNLRRAIGLANGRYCFLLGNDDMLAGPETLAQLHAVMRSHNFPEVVVTNYQEITTGLTYRRMQFTGVLGSGARTAANNFRNFSFVSGLIFDRELARKHETDQWDVAAFYQTYLGTRILASGCRLLAVSDVVILKDVQIPGEQVDTYRAWPVLKNCPIIERPLNLAPIGRLAFAAVERYVDRRERERIARRIFGQLLMFTYPPWLFEYRRIQSWRYAAGICLGMRPKNLLKNAAFGMVTRIYLKLLHAFVSLAGLCIPLWIFFRFKPWLHQFAKRAKY